MITGNTAKKLTVYVEESDRRGGRPVYEVLLEIFHRNKIAGVSGFRGVAGYGSDGVFHTSKILELSASLPIKIEVVDSDESIRSVLPEVSDVVSKGLIEISDTTVVKCCSKIFESP